LSQVVDALVPTSEGTKCALRAPAPLPLGNGSRQRLPKFWGDIEVRKTVTDLYRRVTLAEARKAIISEYGKDRAPSKSAIHRFWQKIDQLKV